MYKLNNIKVTKYYLIFILYKYIRHIKKNKNSNINLKFGTKYLMQNI